MESSFFCQYGTQLAWSAGWAAATTGTASTGSGARRASRWRTWASASWRAPARSSGTASTWTRSRRCSGTTRSAPTCCTTCAKCRSSRPRRPFRNNKTKTGNSPRLVRVSLVFFSVCWLFFIGFSDLYRGLISLVSSLTGSYAQFSSVLLSNPIYSGLSKHFPYFDETVWSFIRICNSPSCYFEIYLEFSSIKLSIASSAPIV